MSEQLNTNENNNDQLSTGLKVLSFCIPLAGAIIYFMNKNESPQKAKTACYAALWGFGFGILLQIIATVLGIGAASMS
ncbi:hypothetical protein GGR32_000205 [Mesonia hippocampi]|uniref:Uncharacterized protein n=1 Tax=Mesonia hippocampi TaxID=1628250 RepID=A0A840EMR9_9FLAO|nr:hypothetical protein [Mesonia hippocampi]MBB4117933.1 hypothetical protein [Mesonia hippocampi]